MAHPIYTLLSNASLPSLLHFHRDADGAVVSFRYRLPATPGKVYLFKTTSSGKGGSTLFHLAQREGDMRTAGMDLAALDGSDQAYFENESFFEVGRFFLCTLQGTGAVSDGVGGLMMKRHNDSTRSG